jgi:transcriptional regulator with XRE-family HTH domain
MESMTLHDRLRIAVGERTYRQIARLTDTHPESVRRYMQGQTPNVDFLINLCTALGINASWLLLGGGPMHLQDVRPHALRTADAADLLRAVSENITGMIGRLDRLERSVQRTESGGWGGAVSHNGSLNGLQAGMASVLAFPAGDEETPGEEHASAAGLATYGIEQAGDPAGADQAGP